MVKLIDPELKSWEKDLMLDVMKYKASLQKNDVGDVGDAKSRDSDESEQNHKLAKTEETFHTQEAIKIKENEGNLTLKINCRFLIKHEALPSAIAVIKFT